MANRLAAATSPYLLQHADNPVDWWEWGEEAFAEARRLNRPILLSVGYAACHWCHVMAHESFEDDDTARRINDRFVAVKVDREERPDVDTVYMQATQALTGHGGWPMTVFLTPDGRPFYAGTYFPPRPAHGMPAFAQVLEAVADAWSGRRDEVLASATQITTELGRMRPDLLGDRLEPTDLERAVAGLQREFDVERGGFGGAPKFPPSMVLEALLRIGTGPALTMATATLEAMARGGIYDQLAGGFARYSVDASWVVPHFEKMLYDNALLLAVYAHEERRSGSPLTRRVVTETVEWLLTEMRTPEGGFAASLDADSLDEHGRLAEGAFYAWSPEQLTAVLGAEDGREAARVLGVTPEGTFEHGRSTLRLVADADPDRMAGIRARLRAARDCRPRPGRDDKVVAAWNGWLVDALVPAAYGLDRPDWLIAATEALDLLWRVHWVDGRLRRTSRDGRASEAPGILEDYGAVIGACARVAGATADPVWLDRARALVAVVEEQFPDGKGGYFDTAADADELYTRPQDPTDNATPSGLSSVVTGYGLLAELTGDTGLAERAERAAATGAELVRRAPRFAGWLLADAASRLGLRPPVAVAVTGGPGDPATAALVRTAYRRAPAGSVVLAGPPDQPGFDLLADRPLRDGRPTAYACRGFVCSFPVTDPEALAEQLEEAQPAR